MSNHSPGKLKIFFGYAAGVGKTYAMLEAAHQAKQEGVDVVVGYVERHTRPDTLALLEGLEILPYKKVDYRGISLNEFDLDAALARNPQLLLVDELAHSNAQGCRHTKRYQDIEELLHAGINIYTTVNVQHIESLNDLVSSITGITVNERIPDHVFDLASQVELVDIEPVDLIKRLKAGKVYKARQARQALEHFFTAENLAALREIAMRRTADHLNRSSIQDGKTQSAKAGEHILVCLSAAPSNAKVIRTAARMSEAFHSGFTALYVHTSEAKHMSESAQKPLIKNIRLAEQLGAKIVTIYGNDPAVQIAEYARISGITKIVMGRLNHKQSIFSSRSSLADRLMEQTDLDIYIIPDHRPLYKKPHVKSKMPRIVFSWKDTGKLLFIFICSTVLSFLLYRAGLTDSNIITIYILGVLVTSVWTDGYLYGACSSLFHVAAFNFFFTEPRFTFQATDSQYPLTFLIMLISGIIASTLTNRVKSSAILSSEKAYYTELLLESSLKLQQGRDPWDCLRIMSQQLNRLFDRPVVYALDEEGKTLTFRSEPSDGNDSACVLSPDDMGVAKWVQKNNKHAGATTNTLPQAGYLFLSVRGSQGCLAVVGIPMNGYPTPDAFEKNLMIAILSDCGASLERLRLQEEKNATALRLQKEHLQASLLRAVSHDLRTPLTNISGSAGILMNEGDSLDTETRHTLYSGISDDSDWLINMTENLLASTKLENDHFRSQMSLELVEDIFRSAVEQLDRKSKNHKILIRLTDSSLMAYMNAALILRVIINIVNNAIQYTPDGSTIILNARHIDNKVQICISDDGPGISDEAKSHLFDLFYTAGQGKADCQRGLGLGLNLCKTIVTHHGGTINVTDNQPKGTVFCFTLPDKAVEI